jgi:uncharacterized delta-60 repeat protein
MKFNNLRACHRRLGAVLLLIAPLPSLAGSGGLDPGFADHGRLVEIDGLDGVARSIEFMDQGDLLIAGGDVAVFPRSLDSRLYSFRGRSFARHVARDGVVDPSFSSPDNLSFIETAGTLRQPDGMVLGVGSVVSGYSRQLDVDNARRPAIFRLASDGSRDQGFGNQGVIEWPARVRGQFRSVVIEPDGRIVVAGHIMVTVDGHEGSRLVVLRRLSDGRRDRTFGTGGTYIGPNAGLSADIDLVRTRSGAYRVVAPRCTIVGLTAEGTVDRRFGSAGLAVVKAGAGHETTCNSLEEWPDGSLLVAGKSGQHAFLARILANGAVDGSFAVDDVLADSLTEVNAAKITTDGRVLIAGSGPDGTSIMRLHATGERDASFGNDGHTFIDFHSSLGSKLKVHDIAVGNDGTVIAAGGADSQEPAFLPTRYRPFVVRLLGDAGGVSPGIVSFHEGPTSVRESAGQVVVRVRRSGGSDGEVSVHYRTLEDTRARAGEDFVPATGTLTWRHGDASDREIVVRIIQDTATTEGRERFGVELSGARGGAGIGTQTAVINIQPDGSPAGQLNIDPVSAAWGEGGGHLEMWLARRYYFEGRVCVTLRTASGSAKAGHDFEFSQLRQCWEDGETEAKYVEIPIIDNNSKEPDERFSVELLAPTGGAVIGPRGSATFKIVDDD